MLSQQAEQVLNLIKLKGRIRPHEIAQLTKTTKQAVHKHIRKLLAEHLIDKTGRAPHVYYKINGIQKNDSALFDFLKKNRILFWDITESKLFDLSAEAIVERVMEFGNLQERKFILEYFKNSLTSIYRNISEKSRPNLKPETINFIKNYIS